jgi:anti-sigma regulatory factor (Ser/Thr protein kinase)
MTCLERVSSTIYIIGDNPYEAALSKISPNIVNLHEDLNFLTTNPLSYIIVGGGMTSTQHENILKIVAKYQTNSNVLVDTDNLSTNQIFRYLSLINCNILSFANADSDELTKSIKQLSNNMDSWRFFSYSAKSNEFDILDLIFPLAERLHTLGEISELTRKQLQLVFQEAMTNSIEHGNLELQSIWKEEILDNGLDRYTIERKNRLRVAKFAERLITIRSSYLNGKILIEITDEGPGFNYHKALSSLVRPEVSLQSFGRGLLIISELMDEISFKEEGRALVMSITVDKQKLNEMENGNSF